MIEVSAAFATELRTPEHIALAEQLGYRRAWCYDSPPLYPDVWMTLGLAATRTARIGLGPGVLIPALRHPMTTAAAIATLEALAPGRVAVGIGSGFTGRMALGQRPMRWADIRRYVEAVRALLRGEETTWDGASIAMLHPERCAPARPVDVPILIGADGPKGLTVADALGDGVFSANPRMLARADAHGWRALLTWGTVLEDDEPPTSPRAQAAVATSVAVTYHAVYEQGGAAKVDALPGGARWRAAIEALPPDRRHLAIHAGHQVELNEHDRLLYPAAEPMTGRAANVETRARLRERLAEWAAMGITEVAYQPAGPDIPRELEAFAEMARDVPAR